MILKNLKKSRSEGQVGLSWAKLELCCLIFELCWAILEAKLDQVGAMLAKLGPSLGVLGPFGLQVGGSGGHVGSRGVLGAMLAHCLAFSKDVQICIDFSTDFGLILNGFLIPRNLNFSVFA